MGAKPRLIALTGAGGKTSLMRWIAEHCRARHKSVAMTTTTKIFPFPGVPTVLEDEGPDFTGRIRHAVKRSPCVCLARRFDEPSGKLMGLDKEVVTALHASRLVDTLIVEADGAARKPLKAPNGHEPVIPRGTELCIGVMGLDAAYRPLTEANVHRHAIFSRLTHLAPGEKVTPAHMVRLAVDPGGLFKGCPPDCDLRVFLNKSDIPGGAQLVEAFHNALLADRAAASFKWFAGSILTLNEEQGTKNRERL